MQRSRRLHVGASKVHKWLSLVIGAQLLIWFASGALMSFLPIEKVRGEQLVDRAAFAALPRGTVTVSSDRLLAQAGAPVETITWRVLDGQPVAEVKTRDGILLFNATGKKVAPIDAPTATRIAQAAWKGATRPASGAVLVTAESTEYKEALPAWRIAFEDADRTRVFVSASTGRIVAVRTSTWRLSAAPSKPSMTATGPRFRPGSALRRRSGPATPPSSMAWHSRAMCRLPT